MTTLARDKRLPQDKRFLLRRIEERGFVVVYDKAYFAAACRALVDEGALVVSATGHDGEFGEWRRYEVPPAAPSTGGK